MKKYVLAGASGRAYYMFAKQIVNKFSDIAEICGVYDANYVRAKLFAQDLGTFNAYEDFDLMLKETKPDAVIITTVDAYHHEYIIKTLEAGCDAITEKPMTIDPDKCRQILLAEKRTGKRVIVTFNYRFVPYVTKIKQLLKTNEIGEILSIDFEWILDKNMKVSAHGTSYFRRWNRYMAKSGGLLVHKSTHHFDMVNWWLDDEPEEVFAFGSLRIYGENGKIRGKNCRNCDHTKQCEFYKDITTDTIVSKFFTPAEHVDGYNKDNCVFAEDIDIYDTMSVNVKYKGGALLNYSLNAHSPYEGWRVSINGTEGRMEAEEIHSGILKEGLKTQVIKVFKENDNVVSYEIPIDFTGHGGGDERIVKMLLDETIPDPDNHMAGSRAGATSILIGACANISIKEKRMVNIQEKLNI